MTDAVKETGVVDNAANVGRDVGRCPVIHLDPSPPMEAGSYWRQADELRERGDAFFNAEAQGYWVFTRHEQVREIYKQPALFSSESFTPWEPEPAYRFIPTQIDPPEHIKYRQILNPWFSPGAVDRIEPTARAVCRRLVGELAPLGACDFIADFALRYPTEVFLIMLGAPGADADLFVPWVDDFFKGLGGDPDAIAGMGAALASIRGYWVEALAERRHDEQPRPGDLASHLLHATVDDRPLTDDEMLDMLTVLVLAGLDTTRAQLGYLFRHLAITPGLRHQLVAEPSLISSAVEESLRLHTIIFGDGRKVTRDADFHGCPLKKGDMVYALVAGANRDPRVFDRADEFVPDRTGNHHFGFAGGPHRCLGAHLARREMQIAVAEWLAAIPEFRIASDVPLIERGGGSMNALLALPLAWDSLGDVGPA
jgi:cytochrome P450